MFPSLGLHKHDFPDPGHKLHLRPNSIWPQDSDQLLRDTCLLVNRILPVRIHFPAQCHHNSLYEGGTSSLSSSVHDVTHDVRKGASVRI